MKVLVVCDVLGEENNGTTIAAMNLIRYLRSNGDDVKVLCADQDKKGMEGYFVVPNLYLGFIINHILKKNNVTLARPVKKIINKALDGVDVVHVMIPFALGNATAKIARKRGIPVTAGFHAQAENFSAHIGSMNCGLVNRIVYKMYYKNLYKRVNAIHYPTQFIKDVFESVIKIKTNGYVISNGVNTIYRKTVVEKTEEMKSKYNILFIGRISKEKSHSVLVKAVSLSKYKDKIQLHFAGQGPREIEVLKLADKLKINKPTMKFYSRKDLVSLINQCDLYVHPAEIEIEAISCLEAISCGLVPVISDSKRSATNKFALDSRNLFKNNDPQDLANKIDYWIEHPKEKELCSIKYLGFAEKFEQNSCMEKMRNMLLTYSKEENRTSKRIYYYKDELHDDFANNGIVSKGTPEKYKYLHKNPIFCLTQAFLYYVFAKPIIKLLNHIKYRQKIVKCYKVHPKKVKGCFFYANHTLDMGDAFTPNLIRFRRNNIICSPEAVSITGVKTIVSMLGAFPLPTTLNGNEKFLDAIGEKIRKGESITIYPEAHIWPYYTKIRDYSCESFSYPVNLNAPSYCITNTHVLRHGRLVLITYIDGPFYPDLTIPVPLAKQKLRDEIYQTMVNRSKRVPQYEKNVYVNLEDIEEKRLVNN